MNHTRMYPTDMRELMRGCYEPPTEEERLREGFDAEADRQAREQAAFAKASADAAAVRDSLLKHQAILTDDTYVVTMFHPHTCSPITDYEEAEAAGDRYDAGRAKERDAATEQTGETAAMPDAGDERKDEEQRARIDEQRQAYYAASAKSSQSIGTHGFNVAHYERLLRPHFDACNHKMSYKDVHRFMLEHDQKASVFSAKNVLRRLKGTDAMSPDVEAQLLQAYVRLLSERGHYCRLLTCDSRTVRVLIIQQAENRFNLMQRRKREDAAVDVGPKFDPSLVTLPDLPDKVCFAQLIANTVFT